MGERRTQWALRARFDEVRQEVAARIGRVSGPLPAAEVEALIRRMTLVQLKYERADHAQLS